MMLQYRQFGVRWPVMSAALCVLLLVGGCGDFFAGKPTEMQALGILEELSQVRESPHVANPLPEVYRQPTSRMTIRGGMRVFYFTRHHAAGHLAALVKEQLGVDASVNAATNQLVLYCKDDAQADAVEGYLELIDVPPVQVNIDCLILERFGSVSTDWETSIMIQNLLGEGITMGEGRGVFYEGIGSIGGANNVPIGIRGSDGARVRLPGVRADYEGIVNPGTLVALDPAFPGAAIRETERGKFGMDFGYWRNQGVPGRQVRAVIDVLTSHGYLKILLNPSLETVNGQTARVTIKDFTPTQEVRTSQGGVSSVYNITQYMWVEDTLTVTPHVYADGSIGLTTNIKIGSRSKPEGVVQRPIITERSINVAENRVMPGESLIIGGMRKSEKRSVIRGIPFFKDLPLLGVLFSSKDFEEKGTEIIFILTPSISSGGREHASVVREIRGKHEDPEFKVGWDRLFKEPFEASIYAQVVEQQAADAELRRMEAELERDEALARARAERDRAGRTAAEAERLARHAAEMETLARQAAQDAQQAAEKAAAAKTETQAQRQQAEQLQQQRDAAIEAAQEVRRQADQAARRAAAAADEATQRRQAAEQAEQALEQARQAAEQIAAEAEKARLEAEARRRAEEEARRQAEEAARRRAEEEEARRRAEEAEAARQREQERQREQAPAETEADAP